MACLLAGLSSFVAPPPMGLAAPRLLADGRQLASPPVLITHQKLHEGVLAPRSHHHRHQHGRGRSSTIVLQQEDDRAETIEYFKTLGSIGGGAFGLFLALTSGAGLEDVLAGNLVLVALCFYGAYLLFFDGGVTQAALENQAIAQLANEEAEVMAGAPKAAVKPFDASAAAADPGPCAAAMHDEGYVRLNGALSSATAAALLEHVNDELVKKREEAQQAASEGAGGSMMATQSFGDVLMKENRYDLYLDVADESVRRALGEVLKPLKPVWSESLGADAELFELAALVSDPRAPRQPVHPDTPWREGQGACAITAFVALQDVDEPMGPTSVLPGTHTQVAHERFNSKDDGGREKVALLREVPNHVGVLSMGDANLIDSRLLHCGGGNESPKRRVLFYVTFKANGARAPTGSLFYHLRRAGYTLENADEWVGAAPAAA